MKSRSRIAAGLGLACALALFGCWRSRLDPVAWAPPRPPERTGVYAPNSLLSSIELLPLPSGHGPESIVDGPEGWLYAGLKGGRIVRFRPDGSQMEEFADTGGRPNGMAFDSAGNLIVADSFRGLLSIGADGSVDILSQAAEGQSFVFNDGVAIGADGTIWFTDATARFPDGEFHYEVLEGSATGRLLRYDPLTRRTRTELANLRFPNGIALGPDDAFLVINETLGYRTLRHWLEGPKAGLTEVFVESYPGFPDDIRFDGRDRFWVALNADRIAWVDWLQGYPTLKWLIAGLVGPIFPDTDTRWIGTGAFVVAVDLEGNVVQSLQDPERRYVTCTGVLEHGGELYLGSVVMDSIGKIPVP